MRTLEQYFKDCSEKNIIDFSLRAEATKQYDTKTRFYIHPEGKDGDTLDFYVLENSLTTIQDMTDGTAK